MEDRDQANKGIELDKIELPSKTTPVPATLPFAKTESEPEVSPRKISPFGSMSPLVSKRKLFAAAVLAGLLVASGVVYLALKDASRDKRGSGAYYTGRIVYEIAASMGGEHDVRFTLSVPFRSDAEKNDLMQKLPSIHQELSMSGSRPHVARSIEQRDFHTLRKHVVNVVHALTGVPTEALDVEALSVE